MSADLRFARVRTPLGPMLVAETDRGVAAVGRADALPSFITRLRRRFPSLEPPAGRGGHGLGR